MFIRNDPRHRGWKVAAGAVLGVLGGVALVAVGVFWAVGAVRVYLQPTARVSVVCFEVDRPCEATWTSRGRTVHGTADDPYSGHRYSRVVHDALFHRTTLTLHVSGTRATMTPNGDSLPIDAGMVLIGGGLVVTSAGRLRALARRAPVSLGAHEAR